MKDLKDKIIPFTVDATGIVLAYKKYAPRYDGDDEYYVKETLSNLKK